MAVLVLPVVRENDGIEIPNYCLRQGRVQDRELNPAAI